MSNVADEIHAMREGVGASSDAELARMLGYTPGALNQWKVRGAVPSKARERFSTLSKHGLQARAMQARREELGGLVLHEGRRLALFFAPSRDALGSRYLVPRQYSGILDEYTALFSAIEVACAEEVADRLQFIGGNAVDAFESLAMEHDKEALLDRILDRARWWRFGDATANTVHDKQMSYRATD